MNAPFSAVKSSRTNTYSNYLKPFLISSNFSLLAISVSVFIFRFFVLVSMFFVSFLSLVFVIVRMSMTPMVMWPRTVLLATARSASFLAGSVLLFGSWSLAIVRWPWPSPLLRWPAAFPWARSVLLARTATRAIFLPLLPHLLALDGAGYVIRRSLSSRRSSPRSDWWRPSPVLWSWSSFLPAMFFRPGI